MKESVLVDFHGVLANVEHCRHYVARTHPKFRGVKEFDKFYEEALDSPPFQYVVDAVNALYDHYTVFVVTARKELWEEKTKVWLDKNGVKYHHVLMRDNDDSRFAVSVKYSLLDEIRDLGYKPIIAFDDNPANIKMYKRQGVGVLIVPGWVN